MPDNEIMTINVEAESGAPPLNGTANQPWYIDSGDSINRSNENISTKNITINQTGVMNWQNVTANITGEVYIKSNAIFNITDCNITLIGNLTTLGELNIINSTLLVNCTTMGEFFISVEWGGVLRISSGSNITGIADDKRIRVLWIDRYSEFFAEDSEFQYIGWTPKFKGVLIEANDTILRNCTFINCYPAVIFNDCSNASIKDCEFLNGPGQYGLNFTNSKNITLINCTLAGNEIGLYGNHFSESRIYDSNFSNNNISGIFLSSSSDENEIKNSIVEYNANGIILENLSQSVNISFCTISNNSNSSLLFKNRVNNCTVYNSSLNDNDVGITIINQTESIIIRNSTIQNSNTYDFQLLNASELLSLNTTYDTGKVQVLGGSNLTIQWFLHIFVHNSTLVPIPEVNITISDNLNGSFELDKNTNLFGWLRWVVVTEYYETDTGKVNLIPILIGARKFGYNSNWSLVNITGSEFVNISINRSLPLQPDLVPTKITLSDQFPLFGQNITLSIEIKNLGIAEFDNNNTNVTVAVFVDDVMINLTSNLSSLSPGRSLLLTVPWKVNVSNGSHTILVMVDLHGNLTELNETNNSLTRGIIINSIPVAILNVEPMVALTYENILFNASDSYDEVTEVGIQHYFYDFGDGTTSGWVVETSVFHNYTDNGTYTVRLMVRDSTLLSSIWSEELQIVILNRPPMANFLIDPLEGTVRTEFTFQSNQSSDLDGTVVGFFWSLSDGTNLTDEVLKYTFGDDIEYSISLKVWDDDGAESEIFTLNLTIQNLAPEVNFSASSVNVNVSEEITFNANATSDPDDEWSRLEFTWDFDDGFYGYNESVITHNYTNPGVYNVTLFVRDDDGVTGKFELSILVNETATIDKPSDGGTDSNMLWIVGMIVTILIILAVIIMLIFFTQSRRLRKQYLSEAQQTQPGLGALGRAYSAPTPSDESLDFTTAGKLDFVILKRPYGKRFAKFELHSTTKSPTEFVGLIWKSALFDKSWVLQEKSVDLKANVITYMQLKIIALNNKNWVIDYEGNGTILKKQLPLTAPPRPKPGVKLSSLDLNKSEADVEDRAPGETTEPKESVESGEPTEPSEPESTEPRKPESDDSGSDL
jgi:PKD repeat protein